MTDTTSMAMTTPAPNAVKIVQLGAMGKPLWACPCGVSRKPECKNTGNAEPLPMAPFNGALHSINIGAAGRPEAVDD